MSTAVDEQQPVPTQLRRNQACLPCRRRRIKCDAAKPHCSSCVRSHHFLQRTQPDEEREAKGVSCFYQAHEEDAFGTALKGHVNPNKKRRQSGAATDEAVADVHSPKDGIESGAKVEALEAKVAELEALLKAQTLYPQPSFTHPMVSSIPPRRTKQSAAESSNGLLTETTIPHPVFWKWGAKETESYGSPVGSLPAHIERDVEGRPVGAKPKAASMSSAWSSTPASSSTWQSTATSSSGSGDILANPSSSTQDTPVASPPEELNLTDVLPPGFDLDASIGPNPTPLMQIFYHGYPANLPSPHLLNHIVQTFFDRVPTLSRLVHRSRFLARLALPPSHSQYPSRGTLHAICAVSARYTAAVKTLSVANLIARTGDKPSGKRDTMSEAYKSVLRDDFGERHAAFARDEIFCAAADGGQAIFETCRAALILGGYYHQHARWVDGWAVSGMIARMLIPLGLQLDSANTPDSKLFPFKHTILPPSTDDIEREERSAVFWQTVVMLEVTSASSGWAGALAMDEVTARLPAAYEDFDSGVAPLNPQTHRSPDIFVHHPVADPYVLSVKMFILLGRCCRFTRQWRHMTCDQREISGPEMPEFRSLDTSIQAFIMSVPASLRDPVRPSRGRGSKAIDADLFAVHVLPHCCSILLHEPFADLADPTDMSARRILTASRAILSFVYLLTGTSVDWSIMLHPVFSYSFFTAARTLVLFLQRALVTKDAVSASVLRSEIEVFRLAFLQFGQNFAMGVRHASMLTSLLDTCDSPMVLNCFLGSSTTGHTLHPAPVHSQDLHQQFVNNHDILVNHHPDMQFTALAGQGAEVMMQSLNEKRGFAPKQSQSPDGPPVPSPQSMEALGASMELDAETLANLETYVGTWDWTEGASMGNVVLGREM